MSVEDWARREVVKDAEDWPVDYEAEPGIAGNAFHRGIIHAFDALLSDEAVEAAHRAHMEAPKTRGIGSWKEPWRAALQAAIQSVTGEKNE